MYVYDRIVRRRENETESMPCTMKEPLKDTKHDDHDCPRDMFSYYSFSLWLITIKKRAFVQFILVF